jgi:hypothetical protein
VLCQVEKAKEDMLNQLYSSIRLFQRKYSLWFQIVDVLEDAINILKLSLSVTSKIFSLET